MLCRLQRFGILRRFSGIVAVDAVPVLAGSDRHTGNGEIFVQFIVGCSQSAPSGGGNCRSDLHGLIKAAAVKQTVYVTVTLVHARKILYNSR